MAIDLSESTLFEHVRAERKESPSSDSFLGGPGDATGGGPGGGPGGGMVSIGRAGV